VGGDLGGKRRKKTRIAEIITEPPKLRGREEREELDPEGGKVMFILSRKRKEEIEHTITVGRYRVKRNGSMTIILERRRGEIVHLEKGGNGLPSQLRGKTGIEETTLASVPPRDELFSRRVGEKKRGRNTRRRRRVVRNLLACRRKKSPTRTHHLPEFIAGRKGEKVGRG